MSRASLAIGFALSLVVHGVFLVTATPRETPVNLSVKPENQKSAKLILPPSPVEEELPIENVKEEPPEQEEEQPPEPPLQEQRMEHKQEEEPPQADPEPEPELEQLEEVVEPSEMTLVGQEGDFSDSESADTLPELRLVWDSPEQLLQVAKMLGMRILVVDGTSQPVGELIFEKDLMVKEFRGKLTSFSNRVRTISAQFFGPSVLQQSRVPFRCFWILVPASVDQSWVAIQKETLKIRGLKSSQVLYMEARVAEKANRCDLVVTKVVPR